LVQLRDAVLTLLLFSGPAFSQVPTWSYNPTSRTTRSFYTYAGSGTTPPCAEGVRRVILTRPVNVTASALRQLRVLAANFLENAGHPSNNRPVMPLNGRTVLHVR
jgi:carbonic anhydrase